MLMGRWVREIERRDRDSAVEIEAGFRGNPYSTCSRSLSPDLQHCFEESWLAIDQVAEGLLDVPQVVNCDQRLRGDVAVGAL
jgi:hypothetical protein